jgi:Tfp pilus assembly protein PilX
MRSGNQRGAVLGLVIISSVIFGIAAFGLLSLAVNRSRQTGYISIDRIRARYAAEAGLVKAMQELWVNPSDCSFGPYVMDTFDESPNNPANDTTVTILATNCPRPVGQLTTLNAKVTF